MMESSHSRVYPESVFSHDDCQTVKWRLQKDKMKNNEEWGLYSANRPWKRYKSGTKEEAYQSFRGKKMFSLTLSPVLSSLILSSTVFAFEIYDFKEKNMAAVVASCIFIMISVSMLSAHFSNEFSLNFASMIAIATNMLPVLHIFCVYNLKVGGTVLSNVQFEWIIIVIFFVFATLPLSYLCCLGFTFVIFACHTCLVIYEMVKDSISQGEIIKQVVLNTVLIVCASVFGTCMYNEVDIRLRNSFFANKNSITTANAIKKVQLSKEGNQDSKLSKIFLSQDSLLCSVLPRAVVKEIIRDSAVLHSNAFRKMCFKCHEDVSILFATISGLECLIEQDPNIFVTILDDIFVQFSQMSQKYFMEEIEWSAVCYNAICNVFDSRPEHATLSVHMAMSISKYIRQLRQKPNMPFIQVRVGIHTGEVYSSIVGICQWRFVICGNDVIKAKSIMDEAKPGEILISHTTRSNLRDEFVLKKVSETLYSAKYVIERFKAVTYRLGIASRRRHRKDLEDDVRSLLIRARDSRSERKTTTNDGVCIKGINEVQHVCFAVDSQSNVGDFVQVVVFVLASTAVATVITPISLAEVGVHISSAVFTFLCLLVRKMMSKCRNTKSSIPVLIIPYIFIIGVAVHFFLSQSLVMVDCRTESSEKGNVTLSHFSEHSFHLVLNIMLLILVITYNAVGQGIKHCLNIATLLMHFIKELVIYPRCRNDKFLYYWYKESVEFVCIFLSLFILSKQISKLCQHVNILTEHNEENNKMLIKMKEEYNVLINQVLPRPLTTSLMQCTDRINVNQHWGLDNVGVATLSFYNNKTIEDDNKCDVHRCVEEFSFQIDEILQKERYSDVHKFTSSGTKHTFVSGFRRQTQDAHHHLDSLLHFLIDLLKSKKTRYTEDVTLKIGLHIGSVLFYIFGGSIPRWGIGGNVVAVSDALHSTAASNTLLVSEDCKDILEGYGHKFSSPTIIMTDDNATNVFSSVINNFHLCLH